MPEFTVASTAADVPPKFNVMPSPVVDAQLNNPVPIQVEFAPAAPMVLNTRSNCRYQGTAVKLIGTVCVGDVPSVVPASTPYWGMIISVPEVLVESIPPALML